MYTVNIFFLHLVVSTNIQVTQFCLTSSLKRCCLLMVLILALANCHIRFIITYIYIIFLYFYFYHIRLLHAFFSNIIIIHTTSQSSQFR